MQTVKTSNAIKVPTGNQGRDNPALTGALKIKKIKINKNKNKKRNIMA